MNTASDVDPTRPLESEADYLQAVRRLVDRGQLFLGWDTARSGLERFPLSRSLRQAGAVALLRAHALDEAKRLLAPLVGDLDERAAFGGDGPASSGIDADEETLGLYARIFKGAWILSGDVSDLRKSRNLYLLSYRLTGGFYTGINVASLSFVLGEREQSRHLAESVLTAIAGLPSPESESYWARVARGEALLLLGRAEEATREYRDGAARAEGRFAQLASSRQQLLLLRRYGLDVPNGILEALQPPTIVVFSGHMLDSPSRAEPRFPASLEPSVAAAIEQALTVIDARIGYGSAASGSDILFHEALLRRGGEINVVLPFARDDFVEVSVAPAGGRWIERFEALVGSANTVTYSVTERYLRDDTLFSHANRVTIGLAHLRGRALGADPSLVVVRDGDSEARVGGTEELVRSWTRSERAHVIDIAALREPSLPALPRTRREAVAPAGVLARGRRIRTILFADMVGFSKLQDENLVAFLDFLGELAAALRGGPEHPEVVNTWGDAIFATMTDAMPMALYALRLRDSFNEIARRTPGLPAAFGIRIALHVGPVFEALDPLTRRVNCYGGAVNRAARLEPVTLPGRVYATRQFVALLVAEEARAGKGAEESAFVGEQVGSLSLAKNFGTQDVYHLRRRRERSVEAEHPSACGRPGSIRQAESEK